MTKEKSIPVDKALAKDIMNLFLAANSNEVSLVIKVKDKLAVIGLSLTIMDAQGESTDEIKVSH